jgi:hypothetical protein
MHVASACAWSGKMSDHFESTYVCSLSLHFYKDLNPWLHGHKSIALQLRQSRDLATVL